jgi:WD40 repeat protein
MLVFDVGRKEALHSVAFAPAGGALVAASESRVYLWGDLTNPKPSARSPGGRFLNSAVRFTPDGRWLFGAGLFLFRWSADTLGVHEVSVWPNTHVIASALHPTEPLVLIAASFHPENISRVGLWHAHDLRPEAALWQHERPNVYRPPLFLPDGNTFLRFELHNNGGPLLVEYATDTGAPTGTAHSMYWNDTQLFLSPDGRTLAERGSNYLELYRFPNPAINHLGRIRNTSKKHFTGAAFHPKGHLLALTSNDATVKLFDVATRAEVCALEWNAGRMRSVCFSPDGALAAAGTDRGQVIVWDVDE